MKKNLDNCLILGLAALAMNCSPAVPQKEAKISGVEANYDCRSLDLAKKFGFKTSYNLGGEKFCYKVGGSDADLSETLFNCDDKEMPLAGYSVITRNFGGQFKGYMKINAVLAVNGDVILYLPFVFNPAGELVDAVDGAPRPSNLEQLFKNGNMMLDQTRNNPEVCKRLLEYKP